MNEDWDKQGDDLWDERISAMQELLRPNEAFGWTWLCTMDFAPETYSLFDSGGELLGAVYQRFNRVICWAPFTWAEEAYRSVEDVGDYGFESDGQRRRHFEKIGKALREWVSRDAVVTGGDTGSHTIAGLTAGMAYTIRVLATKASADDGVPSEEVTGTPKSQPPAQVTGVEATVGVQQLGVSWTAVSGADGYKVQWKSGDEDYGDSRQALLRGSDATSHTITDLTPGTEYTVHVIATKNHAEDGTPSDEVTATPKAESPAQVTGVEVESGPEQLEVSWAAVSDVGGYKVQWKSGTEAYDEARQAVIASGNSVSHTIAGLIADTEYTIRVIATKNNADDGLPSDEVTATPISADPDVNGDGVLDGNDAQILYHSYASADQLGDGETGGTAPSRQSLLAGYSGKTNPSDDDLKAMIRKAHAWKDAGVDAGGDINEDGVVNESDAFVMYYAYTTESLVGNGETGGTARFRQLLLAAFANKDNPTDEDLKAMLRRANELREDFG